MAVSSSIERQRQSIRQRLEDHFGWGRKVGRICQTVCRGIKRVDQHLKLTMPASDIVRIVRLFGAVGQLRFDKAVRVAVTESGRVCGRKW